MGFGELAVFHTVGTGEPVTPAALPGTGVEASPFGVCPGGIIVKDYGVICYRGDVFFSQQGYSFTEDIAAVKVLVHVADLGGIIAVAVMTAGKEHGRSGAGLFDHSDNIGGVVFGHKRRVVLGYMIVDQKSCIYFFGPLGHRFFSLS